MTQDKNKKKAQLIDELVELRKRNAELEDAARHDIAEQRQVAEELKLSEERWRSYTESAPDHVVTLDTDFNIEYVNRPSPGLTIEGLVGTPIVSLAPKRQQAMVQECLESVVSSLDSASY